MKEPLVSVIIPTRNSAATLEACLRSIRNQSYKAIELIVVDRDSTDDTKAIAHRFTDHVYNHGPERSTQRNFGVTKAAGQYLVIIDSDMELQTEVIRECVQAMEGDTNISGVIIPEISFGVGFWASCKALERSYYTGKDSIEAARFLARRDYVSLGGYDESLVAGEDWDLSRRVAAIGLLSHTTAHIRHNECRISLHKTLKKKYYYARHAANYLSKNPQSKLTSPSGPLARYRLFFSNPSKLFKDPVVGLGMLFMKTSEYAAGVIGYVHSTLKPTRSSKVKQ